jgi:hypothetical protein
MRPQLTLFPPTILQLCFVLKLFWLKRGLIFLRSRSPPRCLLLTRAAQWNHQLPQFRVLSCLLAGFAFTAPKALTLDEQTVTLRGFW